MGGNEGARERERVEGLREVGTGWRGWGMEGGAEGRRVRRSEGAREEESVDGGKGEWRGWMGWRAGGRDVFPIYKGSVAISAQASA